MKERIIQEGLAYRLRPITVEDADLIINIRLEDQDRNKYINQISSDVNEQRQWIIKYLNTLNDYYFVIENRLTGDPEGLIGIYNIDTNQQTAEWGRWVIKKGSFASLESVHLILRVAFEKLRLKELYCRTIHDNTRAVSFHDSLPQLKRGILKNFVTLNETDYDVVEHYITAEYYSQHLKTDLERKEAQIFQRNFRAILGETIKFHHIGIACHAIEKDFSAYRVLGYAREGDCFEDPEQGIRGQFIVAPDQPRLELLENLPSSTTLDVWLKNRTKMYHQAYLVKNIDLLKTILEKNQAKTVSPFKHSVYFKKRICFMMLSNLTLIELIEN
jgi:RimJ/RimL family protein N-acetyltransferase